MSTPKYRPDIDGLRGIAVAVVVLFHYGVKAVGGGFVGVDVFFVISGYLITSIIWKEVRAGEFSFPGFYERRVRRILPANLMIVALALVAGYFILLPTDYERLGHSAAYAAGGMSNFYFLWNTGYFDAKAEMQPLLHTWSLAVEEQFYLVWPLLIWAGARAFGKSEKAFVGCLATLAAASFAGSIFIVENDPKVGFYMLHTRAWELALGGLLVFMPALPRKWSTLVNSIGLALIASSVVVLTEASEFPGLNALYPCLGAALVLWPGREGSQVQRLLSGRPLVFIGKISYSLYLVHWPVLVFYRHYGMGDMPGVGTTLVLLGATLVLSAVSWRVIETPFRRMPVRRFANIGGGLAVACAVAMLGAGVAHSGGLPTRLPPAARNVEAYSRETVTSQNGRASCFISSLSKHGVDDFLPGRCVVFSATKKNVLLIGDSHMAHFAKALGDAYPGISFSQITSSGCFPVPNQRGSSPCAVLTRMAFSQYIPSGKFDAIIFSERWTNGGSKRMRASIRAASKFTRNIIVLGPTVEYAKPLPVLLAKSYLRHDGGAIIAQARHYDASKARDRYLARAVGDLGVRYFSVIDALCPDRKCRVLVAGDIPVQFDYGHFTYQGASYVVGVLAREGLLERVAD